MSTPLDLYYVVQICLSAFGVIFFLSALSIIRNEIEKKKNDESVQQDKGLLYISIAISCWILAGLAYFTIGDSYPLTYQLLKSGISTLNNAFFLMAVLYFDSIPSWVPFINSVGQKRWILLVIVFSITTFATTIVLFSKYRTEVPYLIMLPDTLLSATVILLILLILLHNFLWKDLWLLAYVATPVSVVLTLFTTLVEVLPSLGCYRGGYLHVTCLILSKTSLTSLIFISLMSWLAKKSIIPPRDQLFLNIRRNSDGSGKTTLKINRTLISKAIHTKTRMATLNAFVEALRKGNGKLDINKDDRVLYASYVRRVSEDMSNGRENRMFKSVADFQLLLFDNYKGGIYELRVPEENIKESSC